jgi:hypothetical protein
LPKSVEHELPDLWHTLDDEHPNAVQSWSPVPKTHCLTSDFSPAAVFRNPMDEL